MPTTPNMGLILPTVSVTPGPTYATENNQAFTDIDEHDHTAGKGVPVPSEGISITSDLPFGSQNATLLRSARFVNNGSVLALPTDLGCVYEKGGDLYYNNAAGTPVQITLGSTVYNPGATPPDNVTLEISGGFLRVKGLGISTAELGAGSVTNDKLAPMNINYSGSSGTFSTGSTTFVDALSASLTMTNQNRGVMVSLQQDGTSGTPLRAYSDGIITIQFQRIGTGTTVIQELTSDFSVNPEGIVGPMFFMDIPAVAGVSRTYKVRIKRTGGTFANLYYAKLVVTEI